MKFSPVNVFYSLIAGLCLLSVIVTGSVILFINYANFISVGQAKLIPERHRLLDGEPVSKDKEDSRPLAVMIENFVESRPQSGLNEASIVYEVIVEGDITRFLAIFDHDISAEKIGPIRSARPFFVDLAEEWDPVYFHAGGSQAALEQLKQSLMVNVNEISGDGIYFWRDSSRKPPHNLYTSAEQMRRAMLAKNVTNTATFSPWLFKNDESRGIVAENIIIDVPFSSNPEYRPEFRYNPDTNDYTRYLDGGVDKTDKGVFLKTKNVVLQYVDVDIIDDYGRLEVGLEGSGEAEIFQDGIKIISSWNREDGRTRFYDFNGNEIKFNRGKTWIALIFR